MFQGFCKNCYYLSITEDEQNKLKPKPYHICLKHNLKLYHMVYGVNWHPEIPKCGECLLAYGYVYSREVKKSFGEPAVIYINIGSYLDTERDLLNRPGARYEFLPFCR